MEHTSDVVYDGKLLHEVSYPQRADRYTEVELSVEWKEFILSGKVDFYDPVGRVIHETKRSGKVEEAHEWQLKYYLWLFELSGIVGVSGILEYPILRRSNKIQFLEDDKYVLEKLVQDIYSLRENPTCPPKIFKKICKSCSYFDLCYIDEL